MELSAMEIDRKLKLIEWHLNQSVGDGSISMEDALDLYVDLSHAKTAADITRIVGRLQSALRARPAGPTGGPDRC
ncbi:MAG: hypothetical protein ACUVRO_07005 [Armatimonadota bacterium]